jgi:hypothetical protein
MLTDAPRVAVQEKRFLTPLIGMDAVFKLLDLWPCPRELRLAMSQTNSFFGKQLANRAEKHAYLADETKHRRVLFYSAT